jgi:hypothetical protein
MDITTDKEIDYLRGKLMTYLRFWQTNPVSFVYMNNIANILPYQAEALQSVVDNKRTIIRSGHGLGKTFVMALAAIWWMVTHYKKGEGCSIVVTSPSSANLTTVFMPQLSKCFDLLPAYFRDHFEITAESIYSKEDSKGWRLDLRTARKDNPDSMQGQHNVLFLLDEWSGIPVEIYTVVEGAMSDEGSRILAIGNPTKRSGWGYEAFGKNNKLWHTVHLDASIYHSNAEFETVWHDIMGNKFSDFNKGRVDPKEIQKWLDYSGGDVDGAEYRIRVRGEFPMAGKRQFIDLRNIQAAFKNGFNDEQAKAHTIGLDPATSGGDEIALVHRFGSNIMAIKTWHQSSTRKIAYEVRDWLKSEGSKYNFKFIAVDAIGDGKGVYDSLLEMKDLSQLKNVEAVFQYKSSHEANNKERFDRKRDETWQAMKDWFINGRPHFPSYLTKECEALREELVSLTSDFTRTGKLKLESKIDLRKRGVRSPNIADALAMTFSRHDDVQKTKKKDRYRRALDKFMNNRVVDWRAY